MNADREQERTPEWWWRYWRARAEDAEVQAAGLRRELDAERALRQQAEQERDQLRQAFDTEVRVCSARTDMLDASRARVSRLEQVLTEMLDAADEYDTIAQKGPDERYRRAGRYIAARKAGRAALAGDAETKQEPPR